MPTISQEKGPARPDPSPSPIGPGTDDKADKPGSKGEAEDKVKEHDRIYGKDRQETAIKVSEQYWDKADTIIVVTKDNYSDALTASMLGKALDAPILLK